jgi:hypothetical protein
VPSQNHHSRGKSEIEKLLHLSGVKIKEKVFSVDMLSVETKDDDNLFNFGKGLRGNQDYRQK